VHGDHLEMRIEVRTGAHEVARMDLFLVLTLVVDRENV
jgi:hypothetical protein